MELKNNWCLVTGGSKRVGLAISRALAEAGANLILHYRSSREQAESAAAELSSLGAEVRLVQADLGDAESVQRMLAELDGGPTVDVLVNSASVYYPTPLAEVTLQQWNDNLHVNLQGPFLLSQHLGLKMVQRGRGRIVNIVDCNLRRPYRGFLPYLVSKAGLMSLTECLALELAPQVQVNAVAPGTVLLPPDATEEQRETSIRRSPLKRIGDPEDVARMVLHLVLHGDFMTGGYYAVDGGSGIRG
jgi:pteridine reductase